MAHPKDCILARHLLRVTIGEQGFLGQKTRLCMACDTRGSNETAFTTFVYVLINSRSTGYHVVKIYWLLSHWFGRAVFRCRRIEGWGFSIRPSHRKTSRQ